MRTAHGANLTVWACHEYSVKDGFEFFDPLSQGIALFSQAINFVLQLHDSLDTGQVDSLILAQALNLLQTLDIASGVTPPASLRTKGRYQANPIVLTQGLRVHSRELCGNGNHEGYFILMSHHALTFFMSSARGSL
jgi:hypothetical protein